MEFIAVDVETANESLSSICQIGIVKFSNGKIAESIGQFINPRAYFSAFNTNVHGIDEDTVASSPCLVDVWPMLRQILHGQIVVHHTAFDRVSFDKAAAELGLPPFECQWLDSAKVARRTWPECSQRGYGLMPLSEMLGYAFQHHDAVEDAAMAGTIIIEATRKTGGSLEDWFGRVQKSLSGLSYSQEIRRSGADDGPLSGETIVFTGSMSMPRKDAAARAASLGANVDDVMSRRITLLVVGDQDVVKLKGASKSSKHRKAEAMISQGHPIRIITESDFVAF